MNNFQEHVLLNLYMYVKSRCPVRYTEAVPSVTKIKKGYTNLYLIKMYNFIYMNYVPWCLK